MSYVKRHFLVRFSGTLRFQILGTNTVYDPGCALASDKVLRHLYVGEFGGAGHKNSSFLMRGRRVIGKRPRKPLLNKWLACFGRGEKTAGFGDLYVLSCLRQWSYRTASQ
jgi:hypothetical protein